MAVYESHPLAADYPSLRLLELDLTSDAANTDDTIIHATMETYDFRDAPEYEALSYTWGTQDESESIKLNGQLFSVTPNLLEALRQLCLNQRENGKSKRKLWIDAISINQSNNPEKSQQVMQMKEIYANASQVLMWTGKPDDLTGIAFDTLERFSAEDGTRDGSATYRDILDTVEERRAAIHRFIQRPYFHRAWVVQEVVAARTAIVLCGSFSISFVRLNNAVERMTGSGFIPFSMATSNVTYIGMWRSHFLERDGPNREEILGLRLIMDSRDRKATDPRDKVYSLRGIANDVLAAGITVDYDKSIERVYTDCAKHVLKTRPDLRVISAVAARHRTESSFLLPSWVPNWDGSKYGGGILQRYYRFKPASFFCAAGASKPRVTMTESSDTISLEGIRLDTIERVIRIKSILAARDANSFSVTGASLREMAADVASSETYAFTGEPLWKAFFRTLTGDRTALSPRIHDDYRAKFLASVHDWQFDSEGAGQEISAGAWAEISKSIGAIIEDKDMFLTAKGYLGLAQEGFQTGDIVCILCGGDTPFLLRQATLPNGGEFRLQSECYVHGVMDGEMMTGRESDHLESFSIE
ncbi:hypothetical protein GP486_006575 [Trichoglossum hirsutum]|uniref:Heterokaryon incompatibility domain-containing protein n=1 Tax=Trichoglossum hirsutum TaxID=265104 RepID=A0A9P8L7S5_9PEZI|nr:hypothetical protein GP486_006575 [Trichoglossum hirsutum]